MKVKIALTLGDVAGIGPEVVLKALSESSLLKENSFIVIGSRKALTERIDFYTVKDKEEINFNKDRVIFWDLENIKREDFRLGEVNSRSGKASIEFIKKAVELALEKRVDAIVTAPISKEAINKAGFNYHGHTDLLSELTKSRNFAMMFLSQRLKVVLVTIHLPLKEAILRLNPERIFQTIKLTSKAIKDYFGIEKPRIGVAGLNPHSGEGGILGSEEKDCIIPAIKKALALKIDVYGPIAPDILFYKAYRGDFEAVVAMYHDQGLIPVKLVAFEEAVNVTLGLPIIRTSPDHGTGFDIAGKSIANPKSMINAIRWASFMAKSRCQYIQK
jgi:4-hydroxythreonine-4-phosphate dehydrogenase